MGVHVDAWTFDELNGRDSKFLDALDELKQVYVAEIPADTELWTSKPFLTRRQPVKPEKRGRKRNTPRIIRSRPACEVRNLVRYSSKFTTQTWQRYRVKDTDKGPEVWEVKWLSISHQHNAWQTCQFPHAVCGVQIRQYDPYHARSTAVCDEQETVSRRRRIAGRDC